MEEKIHIYVEKDLEKRKTFGTAGRKLQEKAYGPCRILAFSLPLDAAHA